NKAVYKTIYFTQFIWFIVGLVLMLSILAVRFNQIYHYAFYIYLAILFLLILTLVFGKEIRNTRGWLVLGPVHFQFSELAKIATILFLAKFIDYHFREFQKLQDFFLPFLIVLVPVGLILMQPDVGSTLIFFPALLIMLVFGGANLKYMFYILLIGGISVILPLIVSYYTLTGNASQHVWIRFFTDKNILISVLLLLFIISGFLKIIYKFYPRYKILNIISTILFLIMIGLYFFYIVDNKLKPYQKRRLLVFIDSKIDPYGSGYNIIQSKITIGSGRFWGQGFLKGSQTQLGFLPEQTTDFIISVIGEEFGWVGMSFIILLYYLFISQILRIIYNARDTYSALVAVGIGSVFVFQIFINIGMTLGIMPVTGIPLPFLSYGGSSLISSMIAAGVLLNIQFKR
ncbi:MAG: rod shape-determining protein RodA, partial [bacterium]|nr:rod shape-determining protein RodA [bacterium]